MEKTKSEKLIEKNYQLVIDNIKAILIEGKKQAGEILMQSKWEIGDLILQNKYYGIQKKIADDLGVSERNIRECVWFRNALEAPDWDCAVLKLPDDTYTFNKAKKVLKMENQKCEHTEIEQITRYRCKQCGKIWKKRPIDF